MSDNPFVTNGWQEDLASVLTRHDLDQLSGVDSQMLSECLGAVVDAVVRLIKKRDVDMPGALNVMERAELVALRRVNSLQATLLADREAALAEQSEVIVNLNILLRDAYAQRDRVVEEARTAR